MSEKEREFQRKRLRCESRTMAVRANVFGRATECRSLKEKKEMCQREK